MNLVLALFSEKFLKPWSWNTFPKTPIHVSNKLPFLVMIFYVHCTKLKSRTSSDIHRSFRFVFIFPKISFAAQSNFVTPETWFWWLDPTIVYDDDLVCEVMNSWQHSALHTDENISAIPKNMNKLTFIILNIPFQSNLSHMHCERYQ